MSRLPRVLSCCVFGLTLAVGVAAQARASGASTPSQLSALVLVSLPLSVSEGMTTLSVQGVRASATGVELSVKAAGQASEVLIKLPAHAVGGLSIAAGTVIEVTTDSVGHVLRLSGKAIGFIPNEIGKSLIHHAPITRDPTKTEKGV